MLCAIAAAFTCVQAMKEDCQSFTRVARGATQWLALLPSRCITIDASTGEPQYEEQVRDLVPPTWRAARPALRTSSLP